MPKQFAPASGITGDLMANRIIIGTRGSELALWQSQWVKSALERAHPGLAVELEITQTTGDKILDTALSKIGDKGLFTKEIEQQLLAGNVDLAVHSLKDLPTKLDDGLAIGAVTVREDPADVIVSKNNVRLEQLAEGAMVLTGSLRRRAQLLHRRADLQARPVRGNVPTRLRKMDEGDAAAVIMAAAGLKRLGLDARISQRLDPTVFLPACGQGALGLEIRKKDDRIAKLIPALNDDASAAATTAERALLAELQGGCQVPIGAYAQMLKGKLSLIAMVAELDGSNVMTVQIAGSPEDPVALGRDAARQLLANGAGEILTRIRQGYEENESNNR